MACIPYYVARVRASHQILSAERQDLRLLSGARVLSPPQRATLSHGLQHHRPAARHPRPRDVALLVEVSDTTYHRDRGRKWRRYASAGIPIYMIVRLKGPDTLIEVWTGPTGRGRVAHYTDVVRYSARAGESVPIELDGSEHGQVAVVNLVARQA